MESALASSFRQLSESMPIAKFTTSPLWRKAGWRATTFRWHPTSDASPIIGLVFDDAEAGRQLFRELEAAYNHIDRFEEMRISIIEGSPPGQPHGYSVHICPDPDALAMHATGSGIVLDEKMCRAFGKWNRMYPVPGSEPLLPRFKEEFLQHQQFVLAPVVPHSDGQDYFESTLGIIKCSICFRDLSEITPEDIDAGALLLPQLVTQRA